MAWRRVAWICVVLTLACDRLDVLDDEPTTLELDDPRSPRPQTVEEALGTLLPFPAQPVTVRYRIEGPNALTGTMVTTVLPGGYRHDTYDLSLTIDDKPLRSSGAEVQTPSAQWTVDTDGKPSPIESRPYRALAQAVLDLDATTQRQLLRTLHAWHRDYRSAIDTDATNVTTVLGQPCRQTSMGSFESCTWEEANLVLRYRGPGFELTATAIEAGPTKPTAMFTPPHAPPPPHLDPMAILHELAGGNLELAADVLYATDAIRLPPL